VAKNPMVKKIPKEIACVITTLLAASVAVDAQKEVIAHVANVQSHASATLVNVANAVMTAQVIRRRPQNVNVVTLLLAASVAVDAHLVVTAHVANVQNHANATHVNVASAVMTAQDIRKRHQNVNVVTLLLAASVAVDAHLVVTAHVANVQNHANATLVNVANAVMTAQVIRRRHLNVNVQRLQLAADAVTVVHLEENASATLVSAAMNAQVKRTKNQYKRKKVAVVEAKRHQH